MTRYKGRKPNFSVGEEVGVTHIPNSPRKHDLHPCYLTGRIVRIYARGDKSRHDETIRVRFESHGDEWNTCPKYMVKFKTPVDRDAFLLMARLEGAS